MSLVNGLLCLTVTDDGIAQVTEIGLANMVVPRIKKTLFYTSVADVKNNNNRHPDGPRASTEEAKKRRQLGDTVSTAVFSTKRQPKRTYLHWSVQDSSVNKYFLIVLL